MDNLSWLCTLHTGGESSIPFIKVKQKAPLVHRPRAWTSAKNSETLTISPAARSPKNRGLQLYLVLAQLSEVRGDFLFTSSRSARNDQQPRLYNETKILVQMVFTFPLQHGIVGSCHASLALIVVSGLTAEICVLQTVNKNTDWETKKVREDSCVQRCKISQGAEQKSLDTSVSR